MSNTKIIFIFKYCISLYPVVKYLVSKRPCSSVGKATVICSGGRMFEPHRGQRFFLFLRVGPFPF